MYFLKQEYNYTPGFNYSGGGSSGSVKFPEHMEHTHADWLGWTGNQVDPLDTPISVDLISVMDTALASNPLEGLNYSDPTSDVTAMQSEYDSWNTVVDALAAEADWDALITKAREEGVETVIGSVTAALDVMEETVVLKAVQEFAAARRLDRGQLRTRYKANMASISAERSSAYAIGMALMEIDFERETGQFQTEFSMSLFQQGLRIYTETVLRGTQQLLQYKEFIIEMQRQLATILIELKRIGYVMDSEYVVNQAELNWKYSSWDFEVFKNGTMVLGGIGGGTAMPNGPSKASSALGGALSGAASGAMIGAQIGAAGGPIGAGAGAIIGGAIGLGSALLS